MKTSNTSKRLKELMSLKNLRQVDIAEKTGLGKSAISQYVSGKITPKQDKVYILADGLNVSPAWLMGYDVPMDRSSRESFNNSNGYYTDPETAELAEKLRTDPDMKILFSAAKDLTPEEMQQAADYVNYLKMKGRNK